MITRLPRRNLLKQRAVLPLLMAGGLVLGMGLFGHTLPVLAQGDGLDAVDPSVRGGYSNDDQLDRSPLPELKVPPSGFDQTPEKRAERSDELEMASPLKAPGGHISVLQQALKDYRERRIQDAVIGFEAAAKNNSFIARFLLAHIYRTGKSGVVNHRRAYDHYRRITNDFVDADIQYSRHAPYVAHAFVQLARYIEAGVEELEIKADPQHARILYEKAAHFGDVEGQYQLGRFLIESGQVRNVKLGQRWLTRAAVKNNAKAQAYLGALYWQGDLVTRKQALALAWIEFARRNAVGSVKNQVERLYEAVRFDMNPKQHVKAELYIDRLRTKYHVLWRETPVRPEQEESEFLDGIILAEPPKGLDQEQLEATGPRNQYSDDQGEGSDLGQMEGGRQHFGFQFFNYGGFNAQ